MENTKEPLIIAGGEALYRNLLSQGYKDVSPKLSYEAEYSLLSKGEESIILLHIPAVDDINLFPKMKGGHPEMSHKMFLIKSDS